MLYLIRGQDTTLKRNHVEEVNILDNVLLKVKVQIIYFQTRTDELGKSYATSEKRITIAEAEDILLDREIEYQEILKVKYEFVDLEIPLQDLENYITL